MNVGASRTTVQHAELPNAVGTNEQQLSAQNDLANCVNTVGTVSQQQNPSTDSGKIEVTFEMSG